MVEVVWWIVLGSGSICNVFSKTNLPVQLLVLVDAHNAVRDGHVDSRLSQSLFVSRSSPSEYGHDGSEVKVDGRLSSSDEG